MASPALSVIEPAHFTTFYPAGTVVRDPSGTLVKITSGLGSDGKVQVLVDNVFRTTPTQLLNPIIRKGMWVLVPSTKPGEKYIHARVVEDDQFHRNMVVVLKAGEKRTKTILVHGLNSMIPIREAPSFAPIHDAFNRLEKKARSASSSRVSSMPRQSPSTPHTSGRPLSAETITSERVDLTHEPVKPCKASEVIDLTEESLAGPASPVEEEESAPTPYTVVDEQGKELIFYRYPNGNIGYPPLESDPDDALVLSKFTYNVDGSIIYSGFEEEVLPDSVSPGPAGPARATKRASEEILPAAPSQELQKPDTFRRRRTKSPVAEAGASKEPRGVSPEPAGPAEEPSIGKPKATDAKALLKQRRYQWELARPKSQDHTAILNTVFEQSLRSKRIHYIDLRAFEISPEDGLPSQFACEQIPGLSVMNWGVFLKPSAATIPENTLVHVYTGEIHVAEVGKVGENTDYNFDMLKPDEIEITREQKRALGFSPEAKLEVYIDGSQSGNFLRFVNHTGKESANLRAELVKVERTPAGAIQTQVAFYTKKRIKSGDQLMLDYDRNYWKSRGIDPVQIRPESHRLSARHADSKQYRVVCLAKECLCNLAKSS